MKFFILNLAMTDLFVAFCAILPSAIWFSTEDFSGQLELCKLLKFVMIMTLYSSSFALVVMSIDRLEAIICPLRGAMSYFRVYIYVGVAWSMASICAVPGMVMVTVKYRMNMSQQCVMDFEVYSAKAYITYVFVSVLLLPVIAISGCHICMITRIFNVSSQQRMRRMSSSNHSTISRARVKSVKMSCVIVTVFIVCWSPNLLWNMLHTYGQIQRSSATFFITYLMQSLAPLNSVANPIIFWTFMANSADRYNSLWCQWRKSTTQPRVCIFASHIGHNAFKLPQTTFNHKSQKHVSDVVKPVIKDTTKTYLLITTI